MARLLLELNHYALRDIKSKQSSQFIVVDECYKISIFAFKLLLMSKWLKSSYYLLLAGTIISLVYSCAKPLAPTGGPKDETPPEVVRSLPANRSTMFTGDRIILTFNEFVYLKEINQQLIISPPVKETPEFKLRGKNLEVKFKEPLRKETTYNIFFGDAIQDITENNPIPGYKFTFSTGNVLDSLQIEGKLLSAFNLTPVKAAYVMLYDTIYDSVPYKQLPYYIARTNEKGEFSLTNLRDMPYLVFALSDINSNYIFDIPSEEIAFIDSLISPWQPKATGPLKIGLSNATDSLAVSDSVVVTLFSNDSVAVTDTLQPLPAQDSTAIMTDSVKVSGPEGSYLQLFHFREVDSVQTLIKATLPRQNVISLAYKMPVTEPVIRLFNTQYCGQPIIGKNRIGDTLTVWLPGYEADSVFFEFSDNERLLDTIQMSVKPREKATKNETTTTLPKLSFTNNLISGKIKPEIPLRLNFPDPLSRYETSQFVLIEDSVQVSPKEITFQDSVKTRLAVKYPWKEGVSYSLIIPDSVLTSIMGVSNDSTAIKFSCLTQEETSSITLSIVLPSPGGYIIQLLDPKEKLVAQYNISTDVTIDFMYLSPGKYKIKAIDDRNGNGYWDTGKYLKRRYPERVVYFNKELELRANWTLEELWEIPKPGK